MDEEPPSRVPASRGPLLYRGAHTLPVARRGWTRRSGAPRSEVALLTFFGLESGIDAEPCGVSVDAVEPRTGAVCSLDIGQDRLAPPRAGHSAVHELMQRWLGVHRQHRERLRPGEWVRVIRTLVVPQFVFALASGAPAHYYA